jgi:hypothetical protein
MDTIDPKQIENLFIQEELDQHGEFLMDLLVEAIQEKKLLDTSALVKSMYYKINKKEGANSLSMNFYGYGRAIEIRYHTSKNSRKLLKPNTNHLLWNARGQQPPKPQWAKDARWYSKNLYGSLNRLYGRIAWGLGDQEKERLAGIIRAAADRGGKINLSEPPKTFSV